jgi:hypothetical protein
VSEVSEVSAEQIAEALHQQHVAEFSWMEADGFTAHECGNCQRWGRYAAALIAEARAGTDARLLPLRRYVESHIVTARARGLDTEQDWLDALHLLDRS